MLSNLGRAFQFLNCWKYCCFSQKQQPRKSFIPHPGFSSKKPTQKHKTKPKPTNKPNPHQKTYLATTVKCYPSHKQNKHFFDKVPLFHQKILSNYTENTIQTEADCSTKSLVPLVTMEQDRLQGSVFPMPITVMFVEAFLQQHTTGD